MYSTRTWEKINQNKFKILLTFLSDENLVIASDIATVCSFLTS